MRARRLLGAALLTAAVAAARLFPLAPLYDAVSGRPAAGVHLETPLAHLAATPFSSAADLLPCNGVRQDIAFLIFLLTAGFAFFRLFVLADDLRTWFSTVAGLRAFGLYALLCALFLSWAILWPRAMQRLVVDDPDLVAVDFHSHSSVSWDGRRSFTPDENARWHRRAGFDAAFITDHNATAGSASQDAVSKLAWEAGQRDYVSLPGEEISLDGAHVVMLGNRSAADPAQFEGRPGLERLLKAAPARFGALTVLSLPEYWQHHWDDLDTLALWGARGVELYAFSPKGMEMPDELRPEVLDLCRRRNLFVCAATDNHGFAQAVCAWNLMRLPGWRTQPPAAKLASLTEALRRGGFSAVSIAARPRVPAAAGAAIWLDPYRALWLKARAWTWAQSLACLAWIWVLPMALGRRRW